MKRSRDDAYGNSRITRPIGASRGESSGQPQVLGGGDSSSAQELATIASFAYVKEVENMFQDQKEKYRMFLDVMHEFTVDRIDITGLAGRVKELFKGYNNLIIGINTFLPKDYEITVIDEDEVPPRRNVKFEKATSFMSKIKERFKNDDHIYKSFLDILNKYRKEHKGIDEVYSEAASLFSDHPDLLDEFTIEVLEKGKGGRKRKS